MSCRLNGGERLSLVENVLWITEDDLFCDLKEWKIFQMFLLSMTHFTHGLKVSIQTSRKKRKEGLVLLYLR